MSTDVKKILNKSPQKLEEKILKAIFKREDCILDIIDIVSPNYFSIPEYSAIYSAMIELYKKDSDINVETVELYLEENNIKVEDSVIKKLYNESYTSLKIKDTAIILKKIYQRRFILESLRNVIDNEEQNPSEFTDLLDNVNDIVLKSNELIINNEVNTKCCEDSDDILAEIALKMSDKYKNAGLKTGFKVIDNDLGGLKQGNLWTICADSQVGKSMFALELVLNACKLNPDIQVMYQSLEMTKREQEIRALGMQTNIEPSYIDNPKKYFTRFDKNTGLINNLLKSGNTEEINKYKDKIKQGLDELKQYNLYIDDTPDHTIQTLEAHIRKHYLKHGRVDIVVVDHMNILCSGSVSEEVGKLKEGYATLKKLAKKLGCTIICLHQFSNELKNDELRKPNIFNIIGGSASRHFSDVIVGIWRPEIYREVIEKYPELKGHCDLTWQKIRGAKKPEPTLLGFNGYWFVEKDEDNVNPDVVNGYLNSDGEFIKG